MSIQGVGNAQVQGVAGGEGGRGEVAISVPAGDDVVGERRRRPEYRRARVRAPTRSPVKNEAGSNSPPRNKP